MKGAGAGGIWWRHQVIVESTVDIDGRRSFHIISIACRLVISVSALHLWHSISMAFEDQVYERYTTNHAI
jgi:hypothetical protein